MKIYQDKIRPTIKTIKSKNSSYIKVITILGEVPVKEPKLLLKIWTLYKNRLWIIILYTFQNI